MANEYSFGTLSAAEEPIPAPTSETVFRIAVLGDFSGRANRGEIGTSEELAERRGYKVTRDDLDDVMAKMGLRLQLPVNDDEETATLSFQSLDDFHPDQVHGAVDQFSDCSDSEEKSALMNRLLHHPDFQALEGAWRGLDWMLRRAQKGGQVQVVLYDVPFAELAADLGTEDLAKSALYQLLIEKGSRGPKGEPWALIVGNYLFEPTVKHAELLGRLAKIARHSAAPFLAGADPRVHKKDFSQGEEDGAAWAALRQLPVAALLGLALPRFLLRQPYGENTTSIDRFSYEECPSGQPMAYLWGNAGFAAAALVAQGFQKEGWAFKPGNVLDLVDMAMHVYVEDDEEHATLAEEWVARPLAEAMTKLGYMVLLCVKGRNAMQLVRFTSLAQPPKGQSAMDFLGRWGQKGVIKLPSAAPPLSVSVGMGAPTSTSTTAAPAPAPSAPKQQAPPASGEEEIDPELAALMKEVEQPAAAPAGGGDDIDPELAALMADLEKPAPAAAKPAEEEEAMDPELAALMADLEKPVAASEPEPRPAAAKEPEGDMDPELAALMKELEGSGGESEPAKPAEAPPAEPEGEMDPELAALMKELEGG